MRLVVRMAWQLPRGDRGDQARQFRAVLQYANHPFAGAACTTICKLIGTTDLWSDVITHMCPPLPRRWLFASSVPRQSSPHDHARIGKELSGWRSDQSPEAPTKFACAGVDLGGTG